MSTLQVAMRRIDSLPYTASCGGWGGGRVGAVGAHWAGGMWGDTQGAMYSAARCCLRASVRLPVPAHLRSAQHARSMQHTHAACASPAPTWRECRSSSISTAGAPFAAAEDEGRKGAGAAALECGSAGAAAAAALVAASTRAAVRVGFARADACTGGLATRQCGARRPSTRTTAANRSGGACAAAPHTAAPPLPQAHHCCWSSWTSWRRGGPARQRQHKGAARRA